MIYPRWKFFKKRRLQVKNQHSDYLDRLQLHIKIGIGRGQFVVLSENQ
jgi:tRNA G46 methylase TrmB